jgi:hypothetical protein
MTEPSFDQPWLTTDENLITIAGISVPAGEYTVSPARDAQNDWALTMKKASSRPLLKRPRCQAGTPPYPSTRPEEALESGEIGYPTLLGVRREERGCENAHSITQSLPPNYGRIDPRCPPSRPQQSSFETGVPKVRMQNAFRTSLLGPGSSAPFDKRWA